MRIGLLLLAAVWLIGTATAQPTSDLLQSGIYNQETTGDLDAAIRIYRQILGAGAGQRLYAPQAQYRLGECLLRKGDKTGATQAFQAVIRDYPDDKALVARARESMPRGDGLLPAPWKDREVAEYRWTIPGVDDAWSSTYIGPSSTASGLERLRGRCYSPGMNSFDVHVDPDTMRPHMANYSGVDFRTDSPLLKAYESGELVFLLRRMPLAPGWQTSVALLAPDLTKVVLKASVEGLEDVTVPAGSFHCYRVRLSAGGNHASVLDPSWRVAADSETVWYGTDAGRPLVKMESGASKGELTGLRVATPGGPPTVYRDPAMGCSFQVPSGWMSHSRTSPNPPANTIDLLDPETDIWMRINLRRSPVVDPGQVAAALRSAAAGRQRQFLPPESTMRGKVLEGTLGDSPTLSWIADYAADGRKYVEHVVCAQSQSTNATIRVQAPADQFERLRARFQPIIDSFRMR